MTIEDHLELAARWLADTRVREADKSSEVVGAVSAGYDRRAGEHLYWFNEITGYALNAFVLLHRHYAEERYLALARESARHLLSCQCHAPSQPEHGAIFHSVSRHGQQSLRYYSFDTAIVAHGLLVLGGETEDEELQEAAVSAARWLVNEAQFSEGAFRCYFQPSAGWGSEPDSEFSAVRGALHAKHAIPLLKLHRLTGDESFLGAADAVCSWVLSLQDERGAIWANPTLSHVHTHAHCYAAEGLLYAGRHLGRPEFTEAAHRAINWLASVQRREGSLKRTYYDKRSTKARLRACFPVTTSDALAQAIRLWMLTRDERPSFETHIDRGTACLLREQVTDPRDPQATGAFQYQRWSLAGLHRRNPVIYTWPTQFAVQVLRWRLSGADTEELF